MITRREFQHTGVLALAALAGNTAGAGVAARPNVLFIMTDQWRYHAQGYAGCDPVQTPHLDGLARQSQTFHNAIACSSVCGPNRACWMTGLYPQRPVFKGDAPATDALIDDFHHQLYAELTARGEPIPESV